MLPIIRIAYICFFAFLRALKAKPFVRAFLCIKRKVDEVNAVTKTITSAVPYSFDITDIVKKWKSNSNLIEQGLLFSPSDSSSSAMGVFASSEYSTASLRPYLTINYVCNGIYKIKNGSNYIGFADNYVKSNIDAKNMTIDSSDTNDFAKEYRITYISSVDAYTIRPLASKNGYDLYLYSDGSKLILKNSVCYFKFTLNSNGTYKISASNATSKYATAGNTQISMSSTSSSSQNWTLMWSEKNESYAYYESLGFGLPLNSCEVSSRYGVRDYNGYNDHFALDLELKNTTDKNIYSVSNGKVKSKGYTDGYGYYIVIDTEITNPLDDTQPLYILYAHMESQSSLSENARVTKGDAIGIIGNTGASEGVHLHIQFYVCASNSFSTLSSYMSYSTTIDPYVFLPL